jgi:hypothetical protein
MLYKYLNQLHSILQKQMTHYTEHMQNGHTSHYIFLVRIDYNHPLQPPSTYPVDTNNHTRSCLSKTGRFRRYKRCMFRFFASEHIFRQHSRCKKKL